VKIGSFREITRESASTKNFSARSERGEKKAVENKVKPWPAQKKGLSKMPFFFPGGEPQRAKGKGKKKLQGG